MRMYPHVAFYSGTSLLDVVCVHARTCGHGQLTELLIWHSRCPLYMYSCVGTPSMYNCCLVSVFLRVVDVGRVMFVVLLFSPGGTPRCYFFLCVLYLTLTQTPRC